MSTYRKAATAAVLFVAVTGMSFWATSSLYAQESKPSDKDKLLAAAKEYTRLIVGEDDILYERTLVQVLSLASYVREEKMARQLEREIQERQELLQALRGVAVATPVRVGPVEAERGERSLESVLVPNPDAEDFAPRTELPGVPPLGPYYEDPTWRKNMLKLIEDYGADIGPEIFNPHDDESRPVKDLRDCVSIGGPGAGCRCTGTVIADNIVLTAAHCVPCSRSQIYVGWNANNPATGEVYRIRTVIAHPQYNRSTFANDIAIVVLADPIPPEAQSLVRRRRLATTSEITSATSFVAAGFGKTDQGNFGIKLEAPIALRRLYNKEFMAGGGGFDTCQGDSGGPAYVVGADGIFRLAGITSRGGRCSEGGIYVRVDAYRDWIDRTIASVRSAPESEAVEKAASRGQ